MNDLVELSRADEGRLRIDRNETDVVAIAREVTDDYRAMADAAGLRLEMETPGSIGKVHTDPVRVRQVLGNLISNAVKYTQKGGVLVASRYTRGGMRIEIWDTGVGIPPPHQREIFREFYKVPGNAGTDEGFGLGLYIVARLTHILYEPSSGSPLTANVTGVDPSPPPGDWDIEFGTEGMRVDENYYTAEEITADSYWGHQWVDDLPAAMRP